MSLARTHRQKVMQARRDSAPADAPRAALQGKRSAISTVALEMDLRRISQLNTRTQRADYKRKLLIKYAPAVQEFIEKSTGIPAVFVYCMIWLFDVGEFEKGLEAADVAIAKGLVMPDRFRRDVPTFVADAVLEAAGDNLPIAVFNIVFERIKSGTWQIHEEIQAKFYRLIADYAYTKGDWQEAHDNYQAALRLGAPVKTRLAETEKKLTKV